MLKNLNSFLKFLDVNLIKNNINVEIKKPKAKPDIDTIKLGLRLYLLTLSIKW